MESGRGSYLQQGCIRWKQEKWLAYLFSRGAFLWRESGLLEYHATLDVFQGERLRVRMEAVALRVVLGLGGEHGALDGLIAGCRLLHGIAVRLGAVEWTHLLDDGVFGELCEVARHVLSICQMGAALRWCADAGTELGPDGGSNLNEQYS